MIPKASPEGVEHPHSVFLTFGHYHVYGKTGVTQNVFQRPQLTRLLSSLLVRAHPQANFSAMCITYNCTQRCHRDLTNQVGTWNYLLPLSTFQGGDLWVEDPSVPEDSAVYRMVPAAKGWELRKGEIKKVRPSLAFNARRFHEVQEASGDRCMLIGYTPRMLEALNSDDRSALRSLGFPLSREPCVSSGTPSVRSLTCREENANSSESMYECISTTAVLQRCRESVLRVYDQVQYNLKRMVRQARRHWGADNDQGEGKEIAENIRTMDTRICLLEDVLQRVEGEHEEAPALLPDTQVKTLAEFSPLGEPSLEEAMPPARVCVAHAGGNSSMHSSSAAGAPLQTRTLMLPEVLGELECWLDSWREEYSSLVCTHKAVQPLESSLLLKWKEEGKRFQVIPSKLVHTLKAHTARRKTRCVCCGNLEEGQWFTRAECYAGGVDATALRAVLRVAAAWGWAISSFDVKTAFLQSKLLDKHDIPTVVKTPWLWRKHGICQEEFWLVLGALYGLCISPRSWCESRDTTMKEADLQIQGFAVRLIRFESDPNVWWIKGENGGCQNLLGIVAWYIDDALIVAQSDLAKELTYGIAGLWTTSPPEFLQEGQVLVYNGFEIEQVGDQILLHQKSYVTELLSRYPGDELADVPAVPRAVSGEEESNLVLTRQCQALCGELLWLSIRTRPDLCFAVSMMAQRQAKHPSEAWERGLQILRYLRGHLDIALAYGPVGDTELTTADAMSDASFAPQGERSHQCSLTFLGGAVITWYSGRQSFITQSTCESELVALVHSLQDLESQLPFFRELLPSKEVGRRLWCDNRAAVTICEAPFGSWRSRHLHLRANVVKERVQKGWSLQHLAGEDMLADIGTKPLAAGRFLQLVIRLGMHMPGRVSHSHQVAAVDTTVIPDPTLTVLDPKVHSLVRALVLLELLESLPGAEARPVGLENSPHLQLNWVLVYLCVGLGLCVKFRETSLIKTATALGMLAVLAECQLQFSQSHVTVAVWLGFSASLCLSGACFRFWIRRTTSHDLEMDIPSDVSDTLPSLEGLNVTTPRSDLSADTCGFAHLLYHSGSFEVPQRICEFLDFSESGRLMFLSASTTSVPSWLFYWETRPLLARPRPDNVYSNSNHWIRQRPPVVVSGITFGSSRAFITVPPDHEIRAPRQENNESDEESHTSDGTSITSVERGVAQAAAFLIHHGYRFELSQLNAQQLSEYYSSIGLRHIQDFRDP